MRPATDGEESLQSARPSSGSTAGSPLEAGRRWMSGTTLQTNCEARASASMGCPASRSTAPPTARSRCTTRTTSRASSAPTTRGTSRTASAKMCGRIAPTRSRCRAAHRQVCAHARRGLICCSLLVGILEVVTHPYIHLNLCTLSDNGSISVHMRRSHSGVRACVHATIASHIQYGIMTCQGLF